MAEKELYQLEVKLPSENGQTRTQVVNLKGLDQLVYANYKSEFPAKGDSDHLYIATKEQKLYYWVDNQYRQLGDGKFDISNYYWANQSLKTYKDSNTEPTFGTVTSNNMKLTLKERTFYTNLGNPSLLEIAFLDKEWTNKFNFFPLDKMKFERSADGVLFEEATDIEDIRRKKLVGGDDSAYIKIPYDHYLRITFSAYQYCYLNALYLYASPSAYKMKFRIETFKEGTNDWTDFYGPFTDAQKAEMLKQTNPATGELYTEKDFHYSNIVGGWPGHIVMRHSNIPFSATNPQQASKIRLTIRITGKPNNQYKFSELYQLQWWGGYPAQSREFWHVDADKNIQYPNRIEAKIIKKTGGKSNEMLMADGSVRTLELYFNSRLSFPNVGNATNLYIATNENKTYRWDLASRSYHVVGSDYNDIELIDCGGAR